jgi:hypothetical protein
MLTTLAMISGLVFGAANDRTFSFDKPFFYNSAETLKKDQMIFPLELGFPSPALMMRNTAFGLTDRLSMETSLILNVLTVTNLRVKAKLVDSPNLWVSIRPELIYWPSEDKTMLGISVPITVRPSKGMFITVTPGYRHVAEGFEDMQDNSVQEILRFGVAQPWVDIDSLFVVDDRSALAIGLHHTFAAGSVKTAESEALSPGATWAGKMEYLRGIGKTTRVGLAILFNPTWTPAAFELQYKFLPKLSLWWEFPTRSKKKKKKKGTANRFGLIRAAKAAPTAAVAPIPPPPPPAAAPKAAAPAPAVAPIPVPEPAPAPSDK